MNVEVKYNKLYKIYVASMIIFVIILSFIIGIPFILYFNFIASTAMGWLGAILYFYIYFKFNKKLNVIMRESEFYKLGCQYVTNNFNNPNRKSWKNLEKNTIILSMNILVLK